MDELRVDDSGLRRSRVHWSSETDRQATSSGVSGLLVKRAKGNREEKGQKCSVYVGVEFGPLSLWKSIIMPLRFCHLHSGGALLFHFYWIKEMNLLVFVHKETRFLRQGKAKAPMVWPPIYPTQRKRGPINRQCPTEPLVVIHIQEPPHSQIAMLVLFFSFICLSHTYLAMVVRRGKKVVS